MYSIDTLEVVGYADVLAQNHAPSIVPPIFRRKGSEDRFLLPPFSIKEDMVCGATISNQKEFDFLIQSGRITGFTTDPPSGRPHFTLWVDEHMQPHYESDVRAEKKLKALSIKYSNEAKTCIERGDIGQAEEFCNKAISANGNNVSPWAIKAGILVAQGQQDKADFLAETVKHICSKEDFNFLAIKVFTALKNRVPILGA